MRGACRAACTAIDACIEGFKLPEGAEASELVEKLAGGRFPRFQRLDAWRASPAEAVAPLRLLAPRLTSLTVPVSSSEAGRALLGAIPGCTRLRDLRLTHIGEGVCNVSLRLVGKLPELTRLVLDACDREYTDDVASWDFSPWQGLEVLELVGIAGSDKLLGDIFENRLPLPRLRALQALCDDLPERSLSKLWAAPWLPQLTRLELVGWEVGNACSMWAGLTAGLKLPALQVLSLKWSGIQGGEPADRVGRACTQRLAVCHMPALRRLSVWYLGEGDLQPLLAAAWAPQLEALELEDCQDTKGAAAGPALAAVPFSRLARLSCSSGHAAFWGPVLSAAWAPTEAAHEPAMTTQRRRIQHS